MGHRFSKSLTTSNSTEQEEQIVKQKQIQNIPEIITESSITNHNNNQNLIQPTTINLITNQNLQLIQTNCNNQSARRFIIKIQLTKMELPSQQNVEQNSNSSSSSSNSNSKENLSTASTNNNNLNITTQRPQILNLTTFTKNIPCDLNNINSNNNLTTVASTSSSSTTSQIIQQNNNNNNNDEIKLNNLNIENFNNRSAGSPVMVNNNFVSNFSTAPFIDDDNNDLIANNNNNNNNCSATTTSQSLFRQQQQQNNNFENNLNISVQRLQECNIMDNSNCNSNNNNIIGAEYQDVPDINQRVSIHQINNQATTNSIKEKENNTTSTMCANNSQDQKSHCCRRKSSSTSSAYPSKWRCCKCACRDAVKKIVNTGQSSSTNCQNTNDISSSSSSKSGHSWTSRFSCNNKKDNNNQNQQQNQLKQISNDNSSNISTLPVPSTVPVATAAAPTATNHLALWSPDLNPNLLHSTAGLSVGAPIPPTVPTNHLALWSPTNEVVIPITARPGEILVVQCPQSLQCPQPLVCRIEDFEERARRRREIEIETGVDILSQAELDAALSAPWHPIICSPSSAGLTFTAPGGTVVHSRVDYIHCLVPDLEKITSSSFYWGKMDRYEAERLLEGKPEGTFLLRDSAQEEYLFSVTFRKYGRSLHARIEQFNHKFSFDCHDPGVFTAPTVTGLLEHYKDPSCVMFFEPMLTIPLNRNFSFSLQQLCRATIVSNISYDGINELQLPNSLKGYLKEYHYKLRVRVKPFDEPFYSCS